MGGQVVRRLSVSRLSELIELTAGPTAAPFVFIRPVFIYRVLISSALISATGSGGDRCLPI